MFCFVQYGSDLYLAHCSALDYISLYMPENSIRAFDLIWALSLPLYSTLLYMFLLLSSCC